MASLAYNPQVNCLSRHNQSQYVSTETKQSSQNMINNFIPSTVPTQFFMYNPDNQLLTLLDPRNVSFDPMTGLVIPPQGYTAIYAPAPQLGDTANTSSSSEANKTGSPSERSRNVTPEPVLSRSETNKPKRKFPHRSKQIRIKEVHDEVASYFHAKKIYAFSESEVLRGEDTCRVHVKTYKGLNEILNVLKEVHEHPKVELVRIATPISMKNRYQQKGFIVYMKLGSTKQVPVVQKIFEKYKDLYKKCDVAKPKTDLSHTTTVNKTSVAMVSKSETSKVITCTNIGSMMPRAMTKQASVGA